ncbi:MAG: cytochrome c4 [Paraglaciecola sp.]|uniref:c-type cytochrome n=1 Tax=Pseudomonadati TaxID=3379134 RepID=UPI00273E4933|nr:c-type cytochrome [Paraglaciecola sp.]MDP5032693.1 cytochrome c4 [Paraglaciecola sp.]MDP5039359.1 cytochrome c4 [Paraglaciecola sp.]MDP5134149.1 cytochrome c4 [Paraglaciecola sp.]
MKQLSLLICLVFGVSGASLAQGSAEEGKNKSVACGACHGADGNSMIDMNPKLAGQHADYLVKQLKEFKLASQTGGKEGRNNAVMNGMAAALSEQDMYDIAAYFSSQKATPGEAPEDVIEAGQKLYRGGDTARGVTACIACHGPRGDGMSLAGFPDISGQHATYLKTQLEYFRSGERNNSHNGMMGDIAKRLTDQDIEVLSKYIAGLY